MYENYLPKKPNVVFIVADQLSYKNIGCYGNKTVKTPNLDILASKGVKFENAYCQAPLCMPSRASFNTGMYPHGCGVRHNPSVLRSQFTTLAELLRNSGYKTAGFGHIGGNGIESGFDVKLDMIDEPLRTAWMKEQEFVLNGGVKHGYYHSILPFPEEETFDGLAARAATEFIRTTDEPFYLQLDFCKPHPPCIVPEKFANIYQDKIGLPSTYNSDLEGKPSNVKYTRKAIGMEGIEPDKISDALAYYYGSISYIDYLTGIVIKELDKKGIIDDTIIIFTADHGDYAGEFGIIGKTGNFYESLTHVPLIISGNKLSIKQGKCVDSLVELIDIFPTIAEASGVEFPLMIQGSSRWGTCTGATDKGAEAVFCETGGDPIITHNHTFPEELVKVLPTDPYNSGPFSHVMQGVMVRKGNMKLSYYSDGSKELYDLKKDPEETINLSNDECYREIFLKLLEELLKRQINTIISDENQPDLPYHYKAMYFEALPDEYKKSRLEWEVRG